MFESVGIGRILREPDDLDGPDHDDYIISIPSGPHDLHEEVSEASLLNPDMDLAHWVLKRQLKCILRENDTRNDWNRTRQANYFGTLFDLPADDLECYEKIWTNMDPRCQAMDDLESKFILHCGGVQVPADSVKGLSFTASTPKVLDRIVARPVVIVVRVNSEPVRTLVDSGSLGDLVSLATNLVDQLKVKRSELQDQRHAVSQHSSRDRHVLCLFTRHSNILSFAGFFMPSLLHSDGMTCAIP
jgi:hypothetical protein